MWGMRNLSFPPAPYALPVKLSNNEGMGQTVLASPKLVTPVCNLCPGWLLCLMRKKGFCSLLTSLILGLYYKLNWPKRASAVYWLLGTLLYPWTEKKGNRG